jgi:hypothetical protein
MPFWRRESLHEKLAREGGLLSGEPAPHDPGPHWGATGIHGVPRPRRWDAVATADAPELPGEELRFTALPDGTLVVDEDVPDDALAPLADAVERTIEPPYRAEAVRRHMGVWAVAARRIEVLELPPETPGDQLTLTVRGGERALAVDGEHSFGSLPALERFGSERFPDGYVLEAERLDETLWQVKLSAL